MAEDENFEEDEESEDSEQDENSGEKQLETIIEETPQRIVGSIAPTMSPFLESTGNFEDLEVGLKNTPFNPQNKQEPTRLYNAPQYSAVSNRTDTREDDTYPKIIQESNLRNLSPSLNFSDIRPQQMIFRPDAEAQNPQQQIFRTRNYETEFVQKETEKRRRQF
jgi:hypothetical protein